MNKFSKIFLWSGIILILATGLIHVMDAQDSFNDAVYKGWLFYANGVAALIAAYGIYHKRDWGWNLGFMIAFGSLGGYVASRTVGLPFIPAEPDAWFEPSGVAAMIAEGLFMAVLVCQRVRKW